MNTPPKRVQPPPNEWYPSATDYVKSLSINCVWKHDGLRLRVCRHDDDGCYVAPYDFFVFYNKYVEVRVGPYATLDDAKLAAEMLGEMGGGDGYSYSEIEP